MERIVSRQRPKRTGAVHFGLFAVALMLVPKQIGYQDLGALIARQPSVSEHWRQHVFSTIPLGSVAAASFGFGGAMPSPLRMQYASLDLRSLQLGDERALPGVAPLEFPVVNREHKSDRLLPSVSSVSDTARENAFQENALQEDVSQENTVQERMTRDDAARLSLYAIPEADFRPSKNLDVAAREPFVPFPQIDLSLSLEGGAHPENADAAMQAQPDAVASVTAEAASDIVTAALPRPDAADEPAFGTQELFFDSAPLGETLGNIERWQPGEVPVFAPAAAFADPDIKQTAARPGLALASLPLAKVDPNSVTVAPKGVVTAAPRRQMSPADRLKLSGAKRAKAEKCLANAVYFEARGESERGQEAVAQVVMNRVFSEFYPNDVCGVVYQNAHRHLACQFTFACDNVRDVVREPQMYEQAKRIARDTLDGKLWVAEVGKATHYHAYWVHPNWIREMKKLKRIGVHTFYRPRNWGNGADEPHWGDTSTPEKAKL